MSENNWFKEWFDSEYYHILYKNRDDKEAERFIGNLLRRLHLKENSKVIDLACGKGRHAYQLAKNGLRTTGIDLAATSIEYARANYMRKNLDFVVDDMRTFKMEENFDAIFNLFTSFGYFDDPSDNLKVLLNIKEHLKDGGYFILDFMNAEYVVSQLVGKETKHMDGHKFEITRRCDGHHIFKKIVINDGEVETTERVQYLPKESLEVMIKQAGLNILNWYGNYNLEVWSRYTPRTILVAQKEHINPNNSI